MAMKASNSRTGWLRLAEWDKISKWGESRLCGSRCSMLRPREIVPVTNDEQADSHQDFRPS
jgi:hypothetical protein